MSAPTRLAPLAGRIMLLGGWARAGLAVLAGAVSVLALPPFDLWPVMFVTFPVLVWLIDGAAGGGWRGIGAAAVTGWCFGFGYFVAGLYWIGAAFLVDAKTFGWLLPIAVTGLPAYLALFTAFGAAAARLIWTRGASRIVALACMMTLAEYLRGHLLTGFPWNAYGEALTYPLALAQSGALIGLWGQTFLAVLIFASPAALADGRSETKRPALPFIAALVMLAAMGAYGAARLALNPTQFVAGVKLRVVQPALPQDDKFNYAAKQRVMAHYLSVSQKGDAAAPLAGITHLIWPESAFPFLLTREADALAQIAALLPAGTTLITGAIRAPEGATPPLTRAYNSVYALDDTAAILAVYDKVHLVPFGEYLPFQDFLERLGVMQLTKQQGGYLSGPRRRSFDVPRAPVMQPLVCYEIIFPGAALDPMRRAGWIVNLTNDGWFGLTTGPYQHFRQAQMRAIEEGLPVVRAANTGISAVIDGYGRVVASLPLGAEGAFDAGLPQAAPPPPYTQMRDGGVGLAIVAGLIFVLRRRRRV